jgi:UDP-2,3-diacylglucosamine pyrophosphatase LpxH
MVIGHTHHARIVTREENGDFFALIDCGAWIEHYKGDDGQPHENAQIGVICGNNARIYQLRRV